MTCLFQALSKILNNPISLIASIVISLSSVCNSWARTATLLTRSIDRRWRARQQPTRLAWLRACTRALLANQSATPNRPIRTPERLSRLGGQWRFWLTQPRVGPSHARLLATSFIFWMHFPASLITLWPFVPFLFAGIETWLGWLQWWWFAVPFSNRRNNQMGVWLIGAGNARSYAWFNLRISS